jgi:hypothetical protein
MSLDWFIPLPSKGAFCVNKSINTLGSLFDDANVMILILGMAETNNSTTIKHFALRNASTRLRIRFLTSRTISEPALFPEVHESIRGDV